MKFSTAIVAASVAALATASPLAKRADFCGDWDSVTVTGVGTLYNNLWGASGATGSQCTGLDSVTNGNAKWHTSWSWSGTTSIKSYPNLKSTSMVAKQLSAISSIKSTWSWSYTGSNLVTDVAYDLFTSTTATGSANYEIMIWLAAYGGAGAISSTYGSDGKPTPVASSISLAGYTWNLYKGTNGATTVFSFLPASGTFTSFSGDINLLLKYLTSKQGLSSSNYLNSFGAGTEPTSGSNAVFKTTGYTVTFV